MNERDNKTDNKDSFVQTNALCDQYDIYDHKWNYNSAYVWPESSDNGGNNNSNVSVAHVSDI